MTPLDEQAVLDLIAALRAQAVEDSDPDLLVEAEVLAALLTAWQEAYTARPALPGGDDLATQTYVDAIVAEIGALFGIRFLARVFGRVSDVIRRGYVDAAQRVLIEAGSSASMVLGGPDLRALAWLDEDTAWYIRNFHDRQTSRRIVEVGRQVMEQGLSRQRAGLLFQQEMGAAYGQGQAYWTLLAANVATRSREYGRIAGYVEAGITEVYVSAVRDERTSDVCEYLDTRPIQVSDMVARRDAVLAITDPLQIREVAPWRSFDEVKRLVLANDGDIPASVGPPPYHPHCRSRTVIKKPTR